MRISVCSEAGDPRPGIGLHEVRGRLDARPDASSIRPSTVIRSPSFSRTAVIVRRMGRTSP
jgi:hypothetical protein